MLLQADMLVCDTLPQCRANGEIQHLLQDGELPADLDVIELGELTTGERKGRATDDGVTVCDLTGTGVQDTAIANLAYEAATQ